MKLTIPQAALADTVTIASRALPSRSPVPVLAGLLLRADDGQLSVSGFDYETSVQSITAAVSIGEPGEVLVSGRLLADIIKSVRGDVTLHTDGTRLVLLAGSSRFTLHTLPREEYPALPVTPPASGTVPGPAFADAVAKVALAAGTDDTLPILTGIQLAVENDVLRIWATDRYRIALRTLPWQALSEDPTGSPVVPAKRLLETAKSLSAGDVTLALPQDKTMIGVTGETLRSTNAGLDGKLPAYQALIPTEFAAVVAINTAEFARAVKRVALVVERSTAIRLDLADGTLTLRAGSSDDAQAVDQVDADFQGDPMTVAFDPQYLLDGLTSVDAEKTQISLTSPTKPALIHGVDAAPDDGRYLIMPIRLSG